MIYRQNILGHAPFWQTSMPACQYKCIKRLQKTVLRKDARWLIKNRVSITRWRYRTSSRWKFCGRMREMIRIIWVRRHLLFLNALHSVFKRMIYIVRKILSRGMKDYNELTHISTTVDIHSVCRDFGWGYIKQVLDEVGHDIIHYQNRGLCYLPKPKAEADITGTRFW